MYCNNCGCKISSGECRCPNCDTEIKDIEYNGGFWGLVGQVEKESFIPNIDSIESDSSESVNKDISMDISDTLDKASDDNTRVEKDTDQYFEESETDRKSEENKQSTKIKKTYTKRIKLLSCVVILLSVLCAIQTVRAAFAINRYKELKAKYDIIYQDYQSLDSKYLDLNQQLEEMKGKLNDSNDKDSVTETPSAEEKPVTEEPLFAEEKSVIGEVSSTEENSMMEKTPFAEEKPVSEEAPSAEEKNDFEKNLENKNIDLEEENE